MATRLPGPKPYYVTGESPQVWFEPREVWEIRGADLTLSPVHKVPTFPHPPYIATVTILFAQNVLRYSGELEFVGLR